MEQTETFRGGEIFVCDEYMYVLDAFSADNSKK